MTSSRRRRILGAPSPLFFLLSLPPDAVSIATRYDDPILETIARSIHALFPRCVKCGELIARFVDADIRILANRVAHRGACPVREPSSTAVEGAP